GGERVAEIDAAALEPTAREEVAGRPYAELAVPLPDVPPGYHDLHVELADAGRRYRSLLVAAPRKAAGWEMLPGPPSWGVFAPLFALWEEGAPDRIPHFGLLDALARSASERGADIVGTLPLLAAFLDQPFDPSPYAPVSRLFWNELYVNTGDESEVGSSAAWQAGEGPEPTHRVLDYRTAMAERRGRLETEARAFWRRHDERGGDASVDELAGRGTGLEVPSELASFVARNPRAPDYSRFRAATESHGAWPGWPARLRARDLRAGDYDLEAARYHLFAQWQAERQLAEAAERAEAQGVGLYLDLPLGVHTYGYDVWRERGQFALDVTVGAPPDPLAPGGQDWGFHPPHPAASRRDGHRYFIAGIRKHLRFARVLRIDHVMQLHRMFWVPGGEAAKGVYVRYPHDELYAILCIESHRAGSVVVGEDLGTVPRAVRRSLRRHGVPGTYVVQFSLRDVAGSAEAADQADEGAGEPGPALVPGRVPGDALAALGTHDTPMFAAWWTGRDAEIRTERGLMGPEEAEAEVAGRADLREKLRRGLAGDFDFDFEFDFDFDFDFETELPANSAGAAEDARSRGGATSAAEDASLPDGPPPPPEDGGSGGRGSVAELMRTGLAVQGALYRVLGRSEAGLVLASMEDLWMETEPQNVPGTPAETNWRRRARRPVEAVGRSPAVELLGALNAAREGRE
ncbi:MAG: 4-alpha-glucanotransferase, partial [Longimicrobiales bacterium]|nr:4-alpha-glucanotransferase [Longimicrobiales bacterium]